MGTLLTLIIGKLIGIGLMKWFGAGRTVQAIDVAGELLGDANNTITDLRKAAEQAVIQQRQKEIDAMVKELERQRALGEIEVRSINDRLAADRAAGNVPDVTIVPLDGTEEFRSPWKDKQR